MLRVSAIGALTAVLAGGTMADQPLTVQVTPDDGTQYAIRCQTQGKTVIEHAGGAPQVFGFDAGPVDCRVRIVGRGGVEVEASGPTSRTHSTTRGEDAVVTFTIP